LEGKQCDLNESVVSGHCIFREQSLAVGYKQRNRHVIHVCPCNGAVTSGWDTENVIKMDDLFCERSVLVHHVFTRHGRMPKQQTLAIRHRRTMRCSLANWDHEFWWKPPLGLFRLHHAERWHGCQLGCRWRLLARPSFRFRLLIIRQRPARQQQSS